MIGLKQTLQSNLYTVGVLSLLVMFSLVCTEKVYGANEGVPRPYIGSDVPTEYNMAVGQGIEIKLDGQASGEMKVGYWAWSQKLGKTVPEWGGQVKGSPYVIPNSELAKLPSGANKLIVYVSVTNAGQRYGSKWVEVVNKPVEVEVIEEVESSASNKIENAVALPAVKFNVQHHTVINRQKPIDVKMIVDGGLPNGYVMSYWSWSHELGKTVPDWGTDFKANNWVIPGDVIANLPDGRNKIQVAYAGQGLAAKYISVWVNVEGEKVVVEVDDTPVEETTPGVVVVPSISINNQQTIIFEEGKASDLAFTFSSVVPAGTKCGYWAWSHQLKKNEPDWGRGLMAAPYQIIAADLNKLSPGKYTLNTYISVPNADPQYKTQFIIVNKKSVLDSTPDEVPSDDNANESGNDDTVKTLPSIKVETGNGIVFIKNQDAGIQISVSGSKPDGFGVGYWAWSQALGKTVPDWSRKISDDPWEIITDDLNKLPEGRNKIILYAYADGLKTEYHQFWIDVKDKVVANEPVAKLPVVQVDSNSNLQFKLGELTGISLNVEGDLPNGFGIGYWAWSQVLGKTVPDWNRKLTNEPWSISADELSKLPEGRNKLIVYSYADGLETQYLQFWIEVIKPKKDDVPVLELPTIHVNPNANVAFNKGSADDIEVKVSGGLPDGFTLGYWFWSLKEGQTVAGLSNKITQEPWVIRKDELNQLPEGKNKIIIYYTAKDMETKYLQQWIEVIDSDNGGNQGSPNNDGGDGGTNTGNDNGNNSGGNNSGDNGNTGGTNGGTNGGDNGGNSGGGSPGSDSGNNNGSNPGGDPDIPVWSDERLPSRHPFLGMNLSSVTFWSDAWVWANVFRQASYRRMEGDWKVYEALTDSRSVPQGNFTIEFDGEGEVTLQKRDNGLVIRTKGEVENVRVWAPLCGPGQKYDGSTFHPLFLERLKPFSVVRFMDWQLTNNSSLVSWDQQTSEDEVHQSDRPIAPEHMIDLANTLKFNPWFCMPHQADDEFVRKFAEMCRDRLDPNLKVYVEYSNEVWNGAFQQYHWISSKGKANPAYSSVDENKRWLFQWAYEAGRDFDIWSEVFAGQEDRLVRVFAGQEGNPWIAEMVLYELNGRLDALASTAYFGAHVQNAASKDELLALAVLDMHNRKDARAAHKQLAQTWSNKTGRDITYISYEAGQHLTSREDAVTSMMISVQNTTGMYHALIENMKTFEASGGSLYMAYSNVYRPGKWGSWGHLDYQDQPLEDAVKYRALIDYLNSDSRLELSMFD
ncbi:hypothetical protein JD969_03455 [Planctomycetota bacterium]|nr:hypothetical protein JD969_03455 [Planctomycetota bacterium]